MRIPPVLWLAAAALLPACGNDPATGDDVDEHDAATTFDGTPGAPDADTSPDAATCGGAMSPPLAMLSDTEGIAIADDGTVYYSQGSGRVGRWVPGEVTANDAWVTLTPGASTVWGMAIADDGMLYVATPGQGGAGKIWKVDSTAVTPTGVELYPMAGNPNGLTLGPDGAIYYGDFAGSGHVYRVTPAGVRTTVTTSTFAQPNGVLFDDDGTLLVLRYGAGDVYRVTLDGNHVETDRVPVATVPSGGSPDGIARDAQGRYYVTDNGGGVVLRYDATFANPTPLLTGVDAAANMAFGRGALDCNDLFVTSSGALRQIAAGATGVP